MDAHLIPPTSFLPPLKAIDGLSATGILHALSSLRAIYTPPSDPLGVRTQLALNARLHKAHRDTDKFVDSGYASADEDDDQDDSGAPDMDSLRSDTMERAFVIRWLTGFIARSDRWACSTVSQGDEVDTEAGMREEVLEEAGALLASFTEVSEEEEASITRCFDFPLDSDLGDADAIHVELNDAPLLQDDHTSVGLQSWGSCVILAERICAAPRTFGFVANRPLRVLELGAGTGMLSIMAAKLLRSLTAGDAHGTVVATDYHPDVLHNLSVNVQTNFSSPAVEVHALDWSQPSFAAPFDETFDLVLAADVIYHPKHAAWIRVCIERLLTRPSGAFWLIVPVRSTGRHEGMADTVEAIFPARRTGSEGLVILAKEEVGRVAGVGRADEGSYRLFKIGWQ